MHKIHFIMCLFLDCITQLLSLINLDINLHVILLYFIFQLLHGYCEESVMTQYSIRTQVTIFEFADIDGMAIEKILLYRLSLIFCFFPILTIIISIKSRHPIVHSCDIYSFPSRKLTSNFKREIPTNS